MFIVMCMIICFKCLGKRSDATLSIFPLSLCINFDELVVVAESYKKTDGTMKQLCN